MKIYTVGGFVRDRLLSEQGLPAEPGDRDWVVVGGTPEGMLKKGFMPVGRDFPVFLHPVTHEEYALARTEHKTAPGYHGFVFHASPDVSLEEDLLRRDLTINAVALSESGEIIDPCGGAEDLKRGILRHVSKAFAEDPVRILRVARFAAKLPQFSIAPKTMALMRKMVENGEADALVPERVNAELAKGLNEKVPCRMLEVLLVCGLWTRLFREAPLTPEVLFAVHRAARLNLPMPTRFFALSSGMKSVGEADRFLKKLRASRECLRFAQLARSVRDALLAPLSAEDLADVFRRADAVRHPEKTQALFDYYDAVWRPAAGAPLSTERLAAAFEAWRNVDAGAVAKTQSEPKKIAAAVADARLAALKAAWRDSGGNPASFK